MKTGASHQVEIRKAKRRKRRHVRHPISRIDVAPMVGLALILLIMFLVAGPYLGGAGAGLRGSALQPGGAADASGQTLSITVKADGTIFLQDGEVAFEDLVPKLRALSETFGRRQVFVRGDPATPYENVAGVLALVRLAGLDVTLITEPARQN